MFSVKFLPDDVLIRVPSGTTILEAQIAAGLLPDAPCGGQGKCGKCLVTLWDGAYKKEVLACQHPILSNLTVHTGRTFSGKGPAILSDGPVVSCRTDPVKPGALLAAADIGTTTVVCYLMDGTTGQALASASCLNPQKSFGADVVTRIRAANDGHANTLTALIREGLAGLIRQCCRTAGRDPEEISVISIAANTCMQQLFFGMDLKNLASPPFIPYIKEAGIQDARPLLPLCPNAVLLLLPDIAGYVGADTVACILSSGMYRDSSRTLLIDIGTNGEMALGNNRDMIACSTAAGPALEGVDISCGMRGEIGAIDHVWDEDGRLACSVIGNVPAKGICGSGLIDLIAVLLNQGRLNRRGRIQKDFECQNGERVIRLSRDIALTQDDVREVMLAKGAIHAGITLMLEELHLTVQDVDRVYLAGAFGSFIRSESACRIGMIPPVLLSRIFAIGNAAGAGARLAALNRCFFETAGALASSVRHLELASLPGFQKAFAQGMTFTES